MTQDRIDYCLQISTDSHEPARGFGVYATRTLAEEARDFILANWDPEDSYRPDLSCCYIRETPVLAQLPEFHLWSATVDLATGEEQGVHRLNAPSMTPMEPMWEVLEKPAEHVRHPLKFVAGSGKTPDEALANAWRHYDKAVSLGALTILAKCKELAEAAHAEAERRADLASGGTVPSTWAEELDILDELALSEWDVANAAP